MCMRGCSLDGDREGSLVPVSFTGIVSRPRDASGVGLKPIVLVARPHYGPTSR